MNFRVLPKVRAIAVALCSFASIIISAHSETRVFRYSF